MQALGLVCLTVGALAAETMRLANNGWISGHAPAQSFPTQHNMAKLQRGTAQRATEHCAGMQHHEPKLAALHPYLLC